MKNVIKHDAFDKKAFERFLNSNKYFQKLLSYYSHLHPIHEKLSEDIFYAFFKYVVEFNEAVEEKFRINKAILKGLIKNIEYEKIRLLTELDETNAGIATVILCEEIFKNFKKFNGSASDLVREILKQNSKNILEIIEGINSFGFGKGEKNYNDPEDKLKLANRILQDKKLLKIIKKLGKLKLLAINTYKNNVKQQLSEVYSVSLGNEIKYLLPKEIAYLSDEILYYEFIRRFIEKKLLNYSLISYKDSEGAIIVCLDHSGSMFGEKEIWAKAVVLSLIEIAKRKKRKIYYIAFDDDVRFEKEIDPKNIKYEDVIEIASVFYGGGTNFEKPISRAMDVIKEKYMDADILLITDGFAEVSDEFVEKLKEFKENYKVKLMSVFIEIFPTETLKRISDKNVKVYELVDDEAKKIYKLL
ncbi:hypothetical protein J422_00996 [Methanocaldococcus villosus KIN24-T80]|uniref:VWFA domain-containing protein n=1 Tax=Methanocaldococcus villosus KIN24-T80 TaxID=1069083 RepID=N6VU14_9EURY|nr:VWA domain-containing protein [Methanocaldococcus villosus]ENN96671.1 hypothetical protein J422_00996 [Methanocaldococcus villosus KIN24-T80]